VLAAEQARIKAERAQLAKWAKAVAHDEQDIKTALDEALRLLDKPGAAYQRATPTIRRMLNQAIFEQLHILDGEVIQAAPTPLVQALESLARPQRRPRRPQAAGKSLRTAIRAEQEARNDRDLLNGGHGLHNDQMVRPSGLEPPRTKRSTRPSTLRVYQFRHRRRGGEYSRLRAARMGAP
jgi:hypothetical protein